MPEANEAKVDKSIGKELASIKKLLVLLLVKAGTPQWEIGWALGVGQSSVSEMLPSNRIRKFGGSQLAKGKLVDGD